MPRLHACPPSVCLSSLSVCLSSPSVCLSSLSVCLSSPSVCLSSLSVCLSSVCLPVLSVCLPVLSVCLPVPLTRSVSHVSLCRSVSFSLSCSLSHYCCTNVSPERCDGSVITREFPPCRLFPLPPLLTSPQAGNDLPWPRARSGVMSQLVPDFVAQSVFSGFLSDSPGHFPH